MRKLLLNIPNSKIEIKKIFISIIVFIAIIWAYAYNTNYYIVIRFDELGPLTKNMAAYYNGFKIGKVVKIEPDKDFKHTLAKVNLNNNNLDLPQNTTVNVEKFPNGELYLQFLYPNSPSLNKIKRGDILEGISPYSIEQFMLGQTVSGVSDIVSQHVIKALNATEIANQEMTAFFKNTSQLIKDNRKGINTSVNNTAAMTKSLSQMAENLNQASGSLKQTSKKINNALGESTLKTSALNIQDSTSNIKDTTENISKATKDIDKTVKKIDDTISQLNETSRNLNSITSGFNETLSKKFGGFRVLFGTPIKPKNGTKSTCD